MSLLELFCQVDDFCRVFVPMWERQQMTEHARRYHHGQLSLSEIMTILIHFHQAHSRDFKAYYLLHVTRS